MNSSQTFNIIEHLDKLQVVEETASEYHCVCPACGDDNLKIQKTGSKTGRYACYSTGCSSEQIRSCVAPIPKRSYSSGHANQKLSCSNAAHPFIKQSHLDEWVKGSGVSKTLALQNLVSVSDPKEIASLLGWKSYPSNNPGWYVKGVDPNTGEHRNFGQFKPDTPIQFPDDDQPKKYLTFPKKAESEVICLAVDIDTWEKVSKRCNVPIDSEDIDKSRADLGFWRWVLNHPEIPIALTEGVKKAGCLLSQGYVGLAITGVWNGQQGKKKLIPSLKIFVVPGRPVDLIFDADIIVKEPVQDALKLQGHLIHKSKGIVRVVEWDLKQGKGVDDFIVALGPDEFDDVMENATPYSEWLKGLERQFSDKSRSNSKQQGKGVSNAQGAVAAELAEKYRPYLIWNTGIKRWYRYSAKLEGIWSEQSDESIKRLVITEVRTKVGHDFKYDYINGILGLLKAELAIDEWNEQPGLLPLQDGVLELASRRLLSHAPGYRLTWCLPYRWKDRTMGCQPIQDWLLEAMQGEHQLVELLQAYLYAIVTGSVYLQRFLECIGPAGTGKSTFIRLAQALVGEQNTFTTELKHLEHNRFESSGIYGKRLVIITDSERYGGNVTALKALTGQDSLRYERKHIQQGTGFRPTCMAIVAANEMIQSADYTSGLERRRLTVPFLNEVAPENRRNLIEFWNGQPQGEFVPYLPGLLAWVLEMPADRATELIRNTSKFVPSLNRIRLKSLCETNPLADWMDNWLVYRPGAKTYVGIAKREKSSENPNTYQHVDQWLYANYCEYSLATSSKPISLRRFTNLLHDLCRTQLKLSEIEHDKDRYGSYFQGLAIRKDIDIEPRPITDIVPRSVELPLTPGDGGNKSLSSDSNQEQKCDGKQAGCDGYVTAETFTSEECDGCDGFFQVSSTKIDTVQQPEDNCTALEHKEHSNPSQSITQAEILLEQAFQPSQYPSCTHHNPSPSEQTADPIKPNPPNPPTTSTKGTPFFQIGDQCRYCGPQGSMAVTCQKKTMKVLSTRTNSQGEQEAQVKASSWCTTYWIESRHLRKVRQ